MKMPLRVKMEATNLIKITLHTLQTYQDPS